MTTLESLKASIVLIVLDQEKSLNYSMTAEDRAFITTTLITFVVTNASKFIAGCREHADPDRDPASSFVNSVQHSTEITSEILDLWNYHQANLIQLATLTRKLNHITAMLQKRQQSNSSPSTSQEPSTDQAT